jgi:GMP synthase (glutamine-hydrolysing)
MVRILVVEGNDAPGMEKMLGLGRSLFHQLYAGVLAALDGDVQCEFAFPSEQGPRALPQGFDFSDFDGAVLTGSPLHVNDETPAIRNQLAFAERLFAAGVPVFGSCWGLQVMTRALGGRVRANPKGQELGVAQAITLNADGLTHPMYQGKTAVFDCFTVHSDEVADPAPGNVILASNEFSAMQALTLESGGGRFWGVQYHPEFDRPLMAQVVALIENDAAASGVDRDFSGPRAAVKSAPEAFDRIELRNWLASLPGSTAHEGLT